MTWRAPNLPPEKHLFFDCRDGVSTGIYSRLNVAFASRDSRKNILSNLEIAARRFDLKAHNLNLLHEMSGTTAVYIARPQIYQTPADGAVTDRPGIILALYTADCCPVLFRDARHNIIGAAHAGWRGALRGILENTLNLMLERGACKNSIAAALGPCLQQQSFECGADMYEEFIHADSAYKDFFIPGKDDSHYQFNLEHFIIKRLQVYGLNNISASGIDTCTNPDYFSYRRNNRRNLISFPKDYPAHLSTITL